MLLPYIEMSCRPTVPLVSVVRRFVAEFYKRIVGDTDATSRIALATHELLENAVKYSRDGETRLRIEVDTNSTPHAVRIEMQNRAEPGHLAAIREILDGVATAPDPMAFYQSLMVKTSTRLEGSGLGLARICVEADMKLSYRIDGDSLILTGDAQLYADETESAA